jgi:hypothetical protein
MCPGPWADLVASLLALERRWRARADHSGPFE